MIGKKNKSIHKLKKNKCKKTKIIRSTSKLATRADNKAAFVSINETESTCTKQQITPIKDKIR